MTKSFNNRDGWIWMNGEFIEWKKAKSHIISQGLHYASAVFEGERAYNGKIFKSVEHTKRLFKSAEIIGITIIGFIKHGISYLKLFVPSGVPLVLMPLIVIIEIISYLSRPISLSVRLFANMMAGHTMMKVFGGFVISLGIVGGWLPLSFSVALTGLEILVAFLQAYVFAILTCIYLNDALNLHH